MQEPPAISSFSSFFSVGEKGRVVPSTTSQGHRSAWQNPIYGMRPSEDSQVFLAQERLTQSRISRPDLLSGLWSQACLPALNALIRISIWAVDRSEPPKRATQNMHTCVHTCTHTCTHARMHTHTHTCSLPSPQASLPSFSRFPATSQA